MTTHYLYKETWFCHFKVACCINFDQRKTERWLVLNKTQGGWRGKQALHKWGWCWLWRHWRWMKVWASKRTLLFVYLRQRLRMGLGVSRLFSGSGQQLLYLSLMSLAAWKHAEREKSRSRGKRGGEIGSKRRLSRIMTKGRNPTQCTDLKVWQLCLI